LNSICDSNLPQKDMYWRVQLTTARAYFNMVNAFGLIPVVPEMESSMPNLFSILTHWKSMVVPDEKKKKETIDLESSESQDDDMMTMAATRKEDVDEDESIRYYCNAAQLVCVIVFYWKRREMIETLREHNFDEVKGFPESYCFKLSPMETYRENIYLTKKKAGIFKEKPRRWAPQFEPRFEFCEELRDLKTGPEVHPMGPPMELLPEEIQRGDTLISLVYRMCYDWPFRKPEDGLAKVKELDKCLESLDPENHIDSALRDPSGYIRRMVPPGKSSEKTLRSFAANFGLIERELKQPPGEEKKKRKRKITAKKKTEKPKGKIKTKTKKKTKKKKQEKKDEESTVTEEDSDSSEASDEKEDDEDVFPAEFPAVDKFFLLGANFGPSEDSVYKRSLASSKKFLELSNRYMAIALAEKDRFEKGGEYEISQFDENNASDYEDCFNKKEGHLFGDSFFSALQKKQESIFEKVMKKNSQKQSALNYIIQSYSTQKETLQEEKAKNEEISEETQDGGTKSDAPSHEKAENEDKIQDGAKSNYDSNDKTSSPTPEKKSTSSDEGTTKHEKKRIASENAEKEEENKEQPDAGKEEETTQNSGALKSDKEPDASKEKEDESNQDGFETPSKRKAPQKRIDTTSARPKRPKRTPKVD